MINQTSGYDLGATREGGRRDSGAILRQRAAGWGLPAASVILIHAGHYIYGGLVASTSLALSAVAAAVLMGCLVHPGLRQDFGRIKGLTAPVALFAMVLLLSLLSLTPYAPGGPAPVWDYLRIREAAVSINKPATVIEIIRLLGLACFFVIGALIGVSDDRGRKAFNLFVLASGLFGLWAFFTHTVGLKLTETPRLEARFMAANTAGGYFAFIPILALGAMIGAFRASPRKDRLYSALPYAVTVFVTLICLVMTGSRGASIALAVGLGVFALLQIYIGKLKLSRAMIFGSLGFIALAAVLLVAGDLLLSRFTEGAANSDARYQQAVAHFGAFNAAPLMGYGLGTFDAINRSIMTAENVEALWSTRALHNVYLQWLEEAGVLGALPMFGCIALIILTTVRQTARRSRMTNALFALLAADVVVLFHSISDFDLQAWSFAAAWAWLLGLQFTLSRGSRG